MYFEIKTHTTSEKIIKASVDIKIPNKYVTAQPKLGESSNVEVKSEVIEKDDHWLLRVTFPELIAGTAVALPFTFKANSESTPDGEIIDIEAELRDGFDNSLTTAFERYVVSLKEQAITSTMKYNNMANHKNNNNQTIGVGTEDPLKKGFISTKFEDLKPVNFGFEFDSIEPKEFGNRRISKLEIIYELPKGTILGDYSIKQGWKYDEDKAVATRTVENLDIVLGHDIHTFYDKNYEIVTYFPGVELKSKKSTLLTVKAYPKDARDVDDYMVMSSSKNFTVDVNPIPRAETIDVGSRALNSFYDSYSWKKDNLIHYHNFISLPENLPPVENLVLENYGLDDALEYHSVSIFKHKDEFQGTVSLFYIDKQGVKTYLMEKEKLSDAHSFILPIGNEIESIVLESDAGSKLLRKDFRMSEYAKVKDPKVKVSEAVIRHHYVKGSANFVDDGYTQEGSKKLETKHLPYNPKVKIVNKVAGDSEVLQNKKFNVNVAVEAALLNKDDYIGLNEVVVFLPTGFQYMGPAEEKLSLVDFFKISSKIKVQSLLFLIWFRLKL